MPVLQIIFHPNTKHETHGEFDFEFIYDYQTLTIYPNHSTADR